MVDMHKLTPNNEEVLVFPNWLSVKQNCRIPRLEIVLYGSVWTLEKKLS
jgi:hypothetical protein